MFSWKTGFSTFNLFPWALATYASPNQMPSAFLLVLVAPTIVKAPNKVAKFVIVSLEFLTVTAFGGTGVLLQI